MTDKPGFAEVFFDEVRVGPEDALGAPDEGWSAAIRVLAIERATNRMYRAWRFENELRHLVAACRQDPVLSALLQEGPYRQRLAATLVDIELVKGHVEPTVEALLERPVHRRPRQPDEAPLGGGAPALRRARLGDPVAGASRASPAVQAAQRRFQDIYLAARAETIYAGATEIQLDIIADRILQLPRGK